MNSDTLKSIGIFTAGVAVGACAVSLLLKKKFEDQAQEEIAETRARYAKKAALMERDYAQKAAERAAEAKEAGVDLNDPGQWASEEEYEQYQNEVKARFQNKPDLDAYAKAAQGYVDDKSMPKIVVDIPKYNGPKLEVPEPKPDDPVTDPNDDPDDGPQPRYSTEGEDNTETYVKEQDDSEPETRPASIYDVAPSDSEYPVVVPEMEASSRGEEYDYNALTYYTEDDILCDEEGVPIGNPENFIGNQALTMFGYQSGSRDVVYVRNDRQQVYYEIERVNESFVAQSMGMGPEKQPIPKMREQHE